MEIRTRLHTIIVEIGIYLNVEARFVYFDIYIYIYCVEISVFPAAFAEKGSLISNMKREFHFPPPAKELT